MNKTGVFIRMAFMAGVWSCTHPGTTEQALDNANLKEQKVWQAVSPPFEGVEVPLQSFKVMSSHETELKLQNGTSITIPDHAFVDKEGKTIEGTVSVKYREFHRVEDVIVSGIPMTYKAPEGIQHFITTGMFEISGQYKGEEVQVAPNKEIGVNMASYDANSEAKFYVLDKQTNEWKYVSDSKIEKLEREKKADQMELPGKMNQDAFKFDMRVDYHKFPELASYKNVIWQYVQEEGYDNPEEVKGFYEEEWANATLSPYDKAKKQYELLLQSKTKTMVSIVTPVLGERDYRKAKKAQEKKMQQYLTDVQASAVSKVQEAEISRQVSISQFGTYNHDLFARMAEPVVVKAQIKVEGQPGMAVNSLESFLVVKSKNAVIRYSESGYDNYAAFTFSRDDANALIVVLPNKKIAVFDAQEFKNAKVDDQHYVFNVGKGTTEITSLKKMGEVIQSL